MMNNYPFQNCINYFLLFRKKHYQFACHSQNKTINYGNYLCSFRNQAKWSMLIDMKTKDTNQKQIKDLVFSKGQKG